MCSDIYEQRTDNIYEILNGYPTPPLPKVADINDPESFRTSGIEPKTYRYYLIKLAFQFTGFSSFYKNIPKNLEPLLRKINMRLPGLYAPIISATAALLDDPKKTDPVERCASLIQSALDFYFDLMDGKLEADHYNQDIFEMGLYPNLFCNSLKINKRSVKLYKGKANFKINILIRRQFYILDLQEDGKFLSYEDIFTALNKIVRESEVKAKKNEEPSIGLITAANNSAQFKAFRYLNKSTKDRNEISLLNQSFMTFCLDLDSYPSTYGDAAFYAHNTNHGNRWYHSSVQIIVFGNAKTSIIFNFTAYIDGITMARASYELYSRSLRMPKVNKKPNSKEDKKYSFQKLNPRFSIKYLPLIIRDIHRITDNQQATFEISNIGKDYFDKMGADPIPIFVIALFMAARFFTDKAKSIHQFVSMAKYCCVSLLITEVITPEVNEFVKIVEDESVNDLEKKLLLKKALESQKDAIRKTRKELPLDFLFTYFLYGITGLRRLYTIIILTIFSLLSGRIKLLPPKQREILISHPGSREEIPVFGRPGVRLPYVKYFGLHYQIMKTKIIITMMPSRSWQIPNAEFIRVLSEKINKLALIAGKKT